MNQALSTQIPQIGDSSQQLLARMAAAAADENQQIAKVTWLPSAARTTYQFINLTVPPGVVGVVARLIITAVPGVDTLQLQVFDNETTHFLAASSPSAALQSHLVNIKTGSYFTASAAAYTTSTSAGLTNTIVIAIAPSGAGSFTYSASYTWMKK